jgi:hypothetical protein
LNEYIYLEDAQSFQAKLELVKHYKFRGISAWRLGHEDPAVWPILVGARSRVHVRKDKSKCGLKYDDRKSTFEPRHEPALTTHTFPLLGSQFLVSPSDSENFSADEES